MRRADTHTLSPTSWHTWAAQMKMQGRTWRSLQKPCSECRRCAIRATSGLAETGECRKYKVMEEKTFRKREALEEKIPDIRKTLQMVQYLKSKKVRAARVAE